MIGVLVVHRSKFTGGYRFEAARNASAASRVGVGAGVVGAGVAGADEGGTDGGCDGEDFCGCSLPQDVSSIPATSITQ
ncbi:hypothetical protein [Nonomuraea sp. B19D2]|uniref:hypothetical protein n=1 Tax=Nonomuraea sp. B19D2 TaxID=3159561 RepID=UPI0032DB3351